MVGDADILRRSDHGVPAEEASRQALRDIDALIQCLPGWLNTDLLLR